MTHRRRFDVRGLGACAGGEDETRVSRAGETCGNCPVRFSACFTPKPSDDTFWLGAWRFAPLPGRSAKIAESTRSATSVRVTTTRMA